MDTIFRSIDLGNGEQIALGEPISQAVMNDMIPAGPNQYRLKPGSYGGAETIVVEVDANKLVQRMDFGYAQGTDYADLREDFVNEIGPPQEGAPAGEQSTVWQDSQTRFVLFANGSNVGSTLTNLANAAG